VKEVVGMVEYSRTNLEKNKCRRASYETIAHAIHEPTVFEAYAAEHAQESYAKKTSVVGTHSMDSLIRISRALQ
jgi:hypothetical protein